MKLARIAKPLRSLQVRVTLAGDLNAALESYARYYEHVHGDPVDSKTLIPEILSAFLQADREFQPGHVPALPVSSATPNSVIEQWQHQVTTLTPSTQTPIPCFARVAFDTSLIRE